ncbi:unnamed protein product [Cuscuta europaea]|uniref:Uncharacterized protein n=1 Tax=Cuscuta europaea TaxID=41803 RepID=A0A9P0ZB72_CUSEU|nr:unnamed protein product [Cuscuta europaea]
MTSTGSSFHFPGSFIRLQDSIGSVRIRKEVCVSIDEETHERYYYVNDWKTFNIIRSFVVAIDPVGCYSYSSAATKNIITVHKGACTTTKYGNKTIEACDILILYSVII